jgi:hypothetical protein
MDIDLDPSICTRRDGGLLSDYFDIPRTASCSSHLKIVTSISSAIHQIGQLTSAMSSDTLSDSTRDSSIHPYSLHIPQLPPPYPYSYTSPHLHDHHNTVLDHQVIGLLHLQAFSAVGGMLMVMSGGIAVLYMIEEGTDYV